MTFFRRIGDIEAEYDFWFLGTQLGL
jgi:hypothetical protein